jgi:hypothetical protein
MAAKKVTVNEEEIQENETQEKEQVVVAKGLQDIGCGDSDRFTVYLQRNDRKVELNLKPVTMDVTEKIRSAFPIPEPPNKVFSDEEKLRRKMNNQPLNVPDYESEDYKKAVEEVSLKIEWGVLRAALGFDDDPTDNLEAWMIEAKKVFLPGDYMEILGAINKGSDLGRMVDSISPF